MILISTGPAATLQKLLVFVKKRYWNITEAVSIFLEVALIFPLSYIIVRISEVLDSGAG